VFGDALFEKMMSNVEEARLATARSS